MNSNEDLLDESLKKLNQYLYEGWILQRQHLQKHETESKHNGFDVNKAQEEYKSAINDWINNTANYLANHFDHSHYFHFVHPKSSLISIAHPLGTWTVKLNEFLYALEDVIIRIEERHNLAIRKEIAHKEYQADILYEIKFSWHTREIKLNEMLLATPNSDSKGMNLFEYVYSHQNQQLAVKDIEEATKLELSESIHDILRDLGFKSSIRKVFFPIATKTKLMFTNPITKQYAIKNDLPVIKFNK